MKLRKKKKKKKSKSFSEGNNERSWEVSKLRHPKTSQFSGFIIECSLVSFPSKLALNRTNYSTLMLERVAVKNEIENIIGKVYIIIDIDIL